MKYKLIKAMAHNWTHSFMSAMNNVDGDFVFEDLYRLARNRRGEKITISWIPERTDELFVLTPRIRESLKYYRGSLLAHLRNHEVEPDAISEMRTEVYVAEDHRTYVRSYVRDNRGKEHVQFVRG